MDDREYCLDGSFWILNEKQWEGEMSTLDWSLDQNFLSYLQQTLSSGGPGGPVDETVTVTAERPIHYFNNTMFGGFDSIAGYSGSQLDSFSEVGSPTEVATTASEVERQQMDDQARDIDREIATKSDHSAREYGTFVVRTKDGKIARYELIAADPKTPGQIDFSPLLDKAKANGDTVLGVVHNHPVALYGDAPRENQRPSSGIYGNDWVVAGELDSRNGEDGIVMYIIDTQGHLRAYDYVPGSSGPTTSTPIID